MKLVSISMILLGFLTLVASQKPTARQIMDQVDNAPDGDSRRSIMKMTLVNKRGRKRERTILSYSKDYGRDTKKLMFFNKPADVKGTGFLMFDYDKASKEDDRWLYLPAMRKVRRISGSSKNDYFMGSDFTYDDMGDRDLDEYNYKLVGEEKCDGGICWVIESIPKERKDKNYSRTVSWVRKDASIIIKADYYDLDKRLLKKLKVTDLRKHQGFWTSFHIVMNNVQNRHTTHLELQERNYDTDVKDSLFRVSTLERGRVK